MSKRRTKKEKETAHHLFTISYRPEPKKTSFEPSVKGQFKNTPEPKKAESEPLKRADLSAKEYGVDFVKRDIIKSVLLVSFILALELVIYLAVHI